MRNSEIMALLEDAPIDTPTKKDLLRLDEVLKYCDVEHIGACALRRSTSIDSFYAKSLSRLTGTSEVFDDSVYEQDVLKSSLPGEELYEDLKEKAMLIGVPTTHLPYKRLGKEQIILGLASARPSDMGIPGDFLRYPPPPVPPKSPSIGPERPKSSRSYKAPSFARMKLSSTKPPMQGAAMVIPSPGLDLKDIRPGSSVSSFFSNVSQISSSASTASRRNGFRNFFRIGASRRSSYQTVETARSIHTARNDDAMSIMTDAPSAPYSNAQLSLGSSPTSIRSSTSSSVEMPNVPPVHRKKLEKTMKTPDFLQLRNDLQAEADRFADFVAQQRAALPLLYGRNRLYLIERRELEIKSLKEKHVSTIHALEDQHTSQECQEIERQQDVRVEKAQSNTIALKHIAARVASLGEDATEEDKRRLAEEQNAMKMFDIRHEQKLVKMRRDQGRYRVQIEREQKLELARLKEKSKEDYLRTTREKKDELLLNVRKLETVVNKRRQELLNKWHVELQIFKHESEDLKDTWADRQLPLQIIGRPLDVLEMTRR